MKNEGKLARGGEARPGRAARNEQNLEFAIKVKGRSSLHPMLRSCRDLPRPDLPFFLLRMATEAVQDREHHRLVDVKARSA